MRFGYLYIITSVMYIVCRSVHNFKSLKFAKIWFVFKLQTTVLLEEL